MSGEHHNGTGTGRGKRENFKHFYDGILEQRVGDVRRGGGTAT